MTIKYKQDVLAALKAAGYTTYRIRQQRIIGEQALHALRKRTWVTPATIARVSLIIGCKPEDLVTYEPDAKDRAWVDAHK